jgi:hypothetical protein
VLPGGAARWCCPVVLPGGAARWCCPVVPGGARWWCPVVPGGARWCCPVLPGGARWCPVVPVGLRWGMQCSGQQAVRHINKPHLQLPGEGVNEGALDDESAVSDDRQRHMSYDWRDPCAFRPRCMRRVSTKVHVSFTTAVALTCCTSWVPQRGAFTSAARPRPKSSSAPLHDEEANVAVVEQGVDTSQCRLAQLAAVRKARATAWTVGSGHTPNHASAQCAARGCPAILRSLRKTLNLCAAQEAQGGELQAAVGVGAQAVGRRGGGGGVGGVAQNTVATTFGTLVLPDPEECSCASIANAQHTSMRCASK